MNYVMSGYEKIKSLANQLSNDNKSDHIYDITKNNDIKEVIDQEKIDASDKITKYGRSDYSKFRLMGLIAVYIGYFAYGVIDTLYLIILGYILSIAVESYIGWLVSKGISRGFSIFLSYFSLVGVFVAGILLIVPFFAGQVSDLVEIFIEYFTIIQINIEKLGVIGYANSLDLPNYVKGYIEAFNNDPKYINSIQDLLKNSLRTIVGEGSQYVGNAGVLILSVIQGLGSAMFQIGLALTTAILFSIDQENILAYINKITNSRNISDKIKTIYIKIGYRLKSQFILCLIVFMTVYIGLWILEIFGISIPNKLSLALISGITELVPYIGPFIGSIPGVLVGTISNGRIGFVSTCIMYFVVQWTENNIFIPALMNKALGVSPVLIFACVLLGGISMGMVGIILGIPIAIIISVMSE